MVKKSFKNIDEYIAAFPKETQKRLQEIRTIIHITVPEATEAISYGIPTFNLNDRYLVYFAGYKKHIGMYPLPSGSETLAKAISIYNTSGKGTIQFPLDQPLPSALITRIVKLMVKKNAEKAGVKK